MDIIAACEITDKTDTNDTELEFRIVLEHKYNSYKKVFFQGPKETVNEIHGKMSNLLQWHSSQARSNYVVYKELKNITSTSPANLASPSASTSSPPAHTSDNPVKCF